MHMFDTYTSNYTIPARAEDLPSTFSSESSSSSSENGSAGFSDEEVLILASNNPKKKAGRKKFRETRHPVYRGVRRRNSDKWVCEVREPKKKSRIWLGTYPTVEMAARAHDVAVLALRGRSACLNFADSAWRLPVPASADAKDIRRAAFEAAEAFRPRQSESVEEAADQAAESPERVWFEDEEEVFGMHGLLVNMAEGMMLPPPPPIYGDDDVEFSTDVYLWSF